MPALAIYLDAPLQSWGASSKYQYRETNNFPTKSALVGILAAALGIDKHDRTEAEKIAPLSALRLTVAKIPKAHQSTRLMDFHTVGGGYDKNASLREKNSIPQKASGAPFGTVITRRSYLCDAAFIAIFEGDEKTLQKIQNALLNPVWGIWLGRKHCLPATPLTPIIGTDRQDAFSQILEKLPTQEPRDLQKFEYQEEAEEDEAVFYQSDQAIAFGQHHGPIPAPYRARGIHHHHPHPPAE